MKIFAFVRHFAPRVGHRGCAAGARHPGSGCIGAPIKGKMKKRENKNRRNENIFHLIKINLILLALNTEVTIAVWW